MPDETKHAPLPWVVRDRVNGFAYIGHEHPGVPPVALCHEDTPECRANVALIIRAVNAYADLLAACEGLVAAWDGATSSFDGLAVTSASRIESATELARKAIAKANGGAA